MSDAIQDAIRRAQAVNQPGIAGAIARAKAQASTQVKTGSPAYLEAETDRAPFPLPTADEEALQSTGRPGLKGALTSLFDPGFLLDPFNLVAGAGAGLASGGLKGAVKGVGQAASGLYGPIAGFGQGFVKGLRTPMGTPISRPQTAPPPQPSPPPSPALPAIPESLEQQLSMFPPFPNGLKKPTFPLSGKALQDTILDALLKGTPARIERTPTGKMIEIPVPAPKHTGPTVQDLAARAVRTPVPPTPSIQQLAGEAMRAKPIPDYARKFDEQLKKKFTTYEVPKPVPVPRPATREKMSIKVTPASGGAQPIAKEITDILNQLKKTPSTKQTPITPAQAIEGIQQHLFPPHLNPHGLAVPPPTHPPAAPGAVPLPKPDQMLTTALPASQTVVQSTQSVWRKIRDLWPVDNELIRKIPNTPVISGVQRNEMLLSDEVEAMVNAPSFQTLAKMSPETRMKQAIDMEAQVRQTWRSQVHEGMTREQSDAVAKQAIAQLPEPWRDIFTVGREADQAHRAVLGLDPLHEISGPYLPRLTDLESKELFGAMSRSGSVGQSLRTTSGSFDKVRQFDTMADGIKAGMAYEDPLKAYALRNWASAQIKVTATMVEDLVKQGVLTPLKNPPHTLQGAKRQAAMAEKHAEAATYPKENYSPLSPHRFVLNGIPGSPMWAVRSREEAKFLEQNLGAKGRTSGHYHFLNQAFRNPNLWNPLPHIVKNMGVKYWIAGGKIHKLVPDGMEYIKGTNPQLKARFDAVMPFSKTGQTPHDMLGPHVTPDLLSQFLRGTGKLNALSSKVIFAWADPAMRYALWKEYVKKGFSDQAAANHVWVDLIRYSMRSELKDTWSAIPFNFFVAWRMGSVMALSKNLRMAPASTGARAVGSAVASPFLYAATKPFKTALLLGALDVARELYYRETGKTLHMPADYVFGPVARILDNVKTAPYVMATWAMFGPGGEHVVQQLKEILQAIQGKEGWETVQHLFWGLGQAFDMPGEFEKFTKDGDIGHLITMMQNATMGMYQTAGREPKHLSKFIPEDVLETNPKVQALQHYRESRAEAGKALEEKRKERKLLRERALQSFAEGESP